MWNTSTSEDNCKYAWKYRMNMFIEFKYKMDTSIYLKYDALVSVLFLSLLPCLVLWKPNDNPIQFTGNNMLQNDKKTIEHANNIIVDESRAPIHRQHLISDMVNG